VSIKVYVFFIIRNAYEDLKLRQGRKSKLSNQPRNTDAEEK
jgi:hypothetical protein